MIRPTTRRYLPPHCLGWVAESRQSFLRNSLVWRLWAVSPLWSGHCGVPNVNAGDGRPHGWPLPVRRQSALTLVRTAPRCSAWSVAEHDGLAQEPVRAYRAPQCAFGGDAHRVESIRGVAMPRWSRWRVQPD